MPTSWGEVQMFFASSKKSCELRDDASKNKKTKTKDNKINSLKKTDIFYNYKMSTLTKYYKGN